MSLFRVVVEFEYWAEAKGEFEAQDLVYDVIRNRSLDSDARVKEVTLENAPKDRETLETLVYGSREDTVEEVLSRLF